MKRIYLKNGGTLPISDEILNEIIEKMENNSQKLFKFSNKEGKIILVINIDEIMYIN